MSTPALYSCTSQITAGGLTSFSCTAVTITLNASDAVNVGDATIPSIALNTNGATTTRTADCPEGETMLVRPCEDNKEKSCGSCQPTAPATKTIYKRSR